MWAFVLVPLFGSTRDDGAAKRVMDTYGKRLLAGDFVVGEVFGNLYIKENVDVKRQMIYLNLIPDLARFNSKKSDYLSEFFYEVHYVKNAVPDIRRVAHLTTFKHGSGEMDRVLSYMTPDYHGEKLFKAQYLSPLHPVNHKFYKYSIDTTYVSNDGSCRVFFAERFDNIKLLTEGWILFDGSCSVRAFYAEGWDEQSSFSIECTMGGYGLERNVAKEVRLSIDYKFAFNRLDINAEAVYDYAILSNELKDYDKKSRYDLTGSLNTSWDSYYHGRSYEYATLYRRKPLSHSDSAKYIRSGIIKSDTVVKPVVAKEEKNSFKNDKVLRWLWEVGDGMISSHYLNWGDSDLKVYPLINPSYLRYSTSKGVTYKLAMNLKSRIGSDKSLFFKPMVGYSFKRKEFYWGAHGNFVFDARNRGVAQFSIYRDNSIYREFPSEKSVMVDDVTYTYPVKAYNIFRDTRVNFSLGRELFNGFELSFGVNYYYRTTHNNMVDGVVIAGNNSEKYRSFAPNLTIVWHPGMYHYYDGNRKVNLGSDKPRFSLNVEQGVRGILASQDVYTRVELDMQHKKRLTGSATLYTRLGAGGYLYEKDANFISYTFLRDNILPLEKDDELTGVFQMLASEWYNSANRYFRANATYVSPFLMLQKVLPRVNIFKNEMLFFNLLFISDLCPYTELGYGVETPYLNLGVFAGFENFSFYKIGFKVIISLFED